MFREKILPNFKSTLYILWYKAPTMLPAGDQDEVELVCWSICSCIPVPPYPGHQQAA